MSSAAPGPLLTNPTREQLQAHAATVTEIRLWATDKYPVDASIFAGLEFPNLRVVKCEGVDLKTITAMLEAAPNLQELNLQESSTYETANGKSDVVRGNLDIADGSLKLPKLATLTLNGYFYVDGEKLQNILGETSALQTLNLIECYIEGSFPSAMKLDSLVELTIINGELSDEFLMGLLQRVAPHIKTVVFNFASGLSESQFDALNLSFPQLQRLAIFGINDQKQLYAFEKSFFYAVPNLEYIGLIKEDPDTPLTVPPFAVAMEKVAALAGILDAVDTQSIFDSAPNLKCLDLSLSFGINQAAAELLIRKMQADLAFEVTLPTAPLTDTFAYPGWTAETRREFQACLDRHREFVQAAAQVQALMGAAHDPNKTAARDFVNKVGDLAVPREVLSFLGFDTDPAKTAARLKPPAPKAPAAKAAAPESKSKPDADDEPKPPPPAAGGPPPSKP